MSQKGETEIAARKCFACEARVTFNNLNNINLELTYNKQVNNFDIIARRPILFLCLFSKERKKERKRVSWE